MAKKIERDGIGSRSAYSYTRIMSLGIQMNVCGAYGYILIAYMYISAGRLL